MVYVMDNLNCVDPKWNLGLNNSEFPPEQLFRGCLLTPEQLFGQYHWNCGHLSQYTLSFSASPLPNQSLGWP
jgi:hypothetical protein